MIVIDASAMVEALIGKSPDEKLIDALTDDPFAPHLLDVEVLSALRGLSLGGKVSAEAADRARARYFSMGIARYETEPLEARVWSLRHQFTSYDACYLALAEGTKLPLYTCDEKLDTDGHRAEVHVFSRTH